MRFLREAFDLFQFLSRPWAQPAMGVAHGRLRRALPVAATVRHSSSESPNAQNLPSADLRWRKTGENRYRAMWIVKL